MISFVPPSSLINPPFPPTTLNEALLAVQSKAAHSSKGWTRYIREVSIECSGSLSPITSRFERLARNGQGLRVLTLAYLEETVNLALLTQLPEVKIRRTLSSFYSSHFLPLILLANSVNLAGGHSSIGLDLLLSSLQSQVRSPPSFPFPPIIQPLTLSQSSGQVKPSTLLLPSLFPASQPSSYLSLLPILPLVPRFSYLSLDFHPPLLALLVPPAFTPFPRTALPSRELPDPDSTCSVDFLPNSYGKSSNLPFLPHPSLQSTPNDKPI